MADNFTFSSQITIVIKDKEYTLARRNKAFIRKLEELRDKFRKPGITFDELLETYHDGVDFLIGKGSFEAIFGSEEDADIDSVAELYTYIINQYRNLNLHD